MLKEARKAILADHSDLFGVLAHIAFAATSKTRQQRADHGRSVTERPYEPKIAAFVNSVLGQNVKTEAEGLDRSRLPEFLKRKFGTPGDGANALGGVDQVAGSYIEFQRHLYARVGEHIDGTPHVAAGHLADFDKGKQRTVRRDGDAHQAICRSAPRGEKPRRSPNRHSDPLQR